jgi:hypothetical protein
VLAEKFFLVLETIRSHASDRSVKVVSITPHIPAKLPPPRIAEAVRRPLLAG